MTKVLMKNEIISKIDFVCPSCGCNDFNEIQKDVTLSIPVTHVHSPEGRMLPDVEYDNPEIFDGNLSHYECNKCSKTITKIDNNAVKDSLELWDWLVANYWTIKFDKMENGRPDELHEKIFDLEIENATYVVNDNTMPICQYVVRGLGWEAANSFFYKLHDEEE